MAVYVDFRKNRAGSLFRLWDTQSKSYATGDLNLGGIHLAIKGLLAEGGIPESSDASAVTYNWVATAINDGTNDPSGNAAGTADCPWRTADELAVPGPLRTALRASALSEQAIRAIFDIRLSRWGDRLSPDARTFLDETLVLQWLLRGNGAATIRVERAPSSPPRGYRNLERAETLVAEIAAEWQDALTVETIDPGDPEPVTHLFRLR